MIPLFGAAFLVAGFVVIVRALGLEATSREVIVEARRSVDVVRNADFDDDTKEKALQATAKKLFRLFLLLTFGCGVALMAPLLVVWVGDWLGWISFDDVLRTSLSPVFLVISGLAACIALFWKPKPRAADAGDGYSSIDRLLHRLAFHSTTAQLGMADIEDRLFAKELATCSAECPVFVTALPRAGTTLLLECLARIPEFAAHCYRDMPFVLVPMLWGRFSQSFRKNGELRERAHGDGMTIDFDSPEALEEVVWAAFWRKQYAADRIRPWGEGIDEEFAAFFPGHMRKIIALRRPESPSAVRYVSKNNLNIARLGLLRAMFPDAAIVIPFRRPLEHAASLLQQHRNFLEIHEKDRFAAEYMRAIGHFDFGVNLRPVDFDGWFDACRYDATTLPFWLSYWVATYRALLHAPHGATFHSYENLCADPMRELLTLSRVIGCRGSETMLAAAKNIRPVRSRDVDRSDLPPALVTEAESLHEQLLNVARGVTGRDSRNVEGQFASV